MIVGIKFPPIGPPAFGKRVHSGTSLSCLDEHRDARKRGRCQRT
jgi:hypothetical protein